MTDDRRFALAVETIYSTALEPANWPKTLQSIADVFDDVGAVLSYQRDGGGFGAISSPSLQPLISEYDATFAGQDLRALRGLERGIFLGKDAVTDRDLVTQEEMDTHRFYKLLARHNLRYFAAACFAPSLNIYAGISVQRVIGKPPFSEEEMEVCRQLGLHAEKALRISIRLLNAELANEGLKEALGRLGFGIFALDSVKRIVFSNQISESLLGDGLLAVDKKLKIGRSANRTKIEEAIDAVLNGSMFQASAQAAPILVERSSCLRPIVLYVLPIGHLKTPAQAFLTNARVLILAIDPAMEASADPAVVRDLLGLTLGEARIAALVGAGSSPRQASEQLGITEETTRTALKRVFLKVGVNRQSELAALLARLVLR